MEFFRQEYCSGLPCSPPGDLPNPGIEPRSPALQADFLPSEPPGKPKNTGVGCHALLQGIFPTQGSNSGLWSCRQIFYHLSHQGSPCCMAQRKKETKEGRREERSSGRPPLTGQCGGREKSLTCNSPKLCASHVTLASPSNLAELRVPYLRIRESASLP